MWVFSYTVDHYAFCRTSAHTHPVSGVINKILSPICNQLHLCYLLYVCLAVWSCIKKCVGVCVSQLHHLECISVCRSMLQHRRGPLKTQRHFLTSASSCNSHMHACVLAHTHTHKQVCVCVSVCVFINNCNHSLHLTVVFLCAYMHLCRSVCILCSLGMNHKCHQKCSKQSSTFALFYNRWGTDRKCG